MRLDMHINIQIAALRAAHASLALCVVVVVDIIGGGGGGGVAKRLAINLAPQFTSIMVQR